MNPEEKVMLPFILLVAVVIAFQGDMITSAIITFIMGITYGRRIRAWWGRG